MANTTANEDWLILNDALAEAWCRRTETLLRSVLGFDIGVGLRLPSQEQAARCLHDNVTLQGMLSLSSGKSHAEICVTIPFEGVFIADGNGSAQTLVWGSWLSERPGIRRVQMRVASDGKAGQPSDNAKRKGDNLWLAFPDGSNLAVPLSPPLQMGTKREEKILNRATSLLRRIPFGPLWTESDYPWRWLRNALKTASAKITAAADIQDRNARRHVQVDAARDLVNALAGHAGDFPDATDADKLDFRVLTTFPRWLSFRLCQYLVQLRAQGNGKFENAESLIDHLRRRKPEGVGRAILPVDHLSRTGELVRVAPVNAVELLARLTGVRRYRFRRASAANVPAEMRQNHASFAGRLCPFESPESELVGLQLQLARGARIDSGGTIHPSDTGRPIDKLGWGAALVPFAHCNDGARVMMGAKNLRQAVPVAACAAPFVKTGAEASLASRIGRLAEIGVCPGCLDGGGELALGLDLLVAYMPWHGWNVDDALVVSESAARKLGIVERKPFARPVEAGISCQVPQGVKKDAVLQFGDVIAVLRDSEGLETPLFCQDPNGMTIVRPPLSFKAKSSVEHVLSFSFEETLPLGPGDKMMGRYGNKGVVARVLKDSDMPRLPDDQKLPHNLRGKPLEVLVNPHGVLSRMNPGQLLETHIGWLLHAGVGESELLAADSPKVAVGDLAARLDHAKIRQLLEKTGLDRFGAIRLKLPAEESANMPYTEAPVVVGFQHYVRLHHVPSLKAQARRGGDYAAYAAATRQAAHGRKAGGGQRLGEMEVWALAAHGANAILGEMLGVKSDALLARGGNPARKGFGALLDDWLLALCAQCETKGDGARFTPLVDREVLFSRMDLPPDGSSGKVVHGVFPEEGKPPKPGTLFDEAIFGDGKVDEDRWGYIEFPRPIPHPWKSEVAISILPVLPLRYRLPMRDRYDPEDPAWRLNLAYRGIIEAVKAEKSREEASSDNGDASQANAVERLFQLFEERLNGKEGLLRHEGLGRRVDRSFRLVIAPDPTLDWNQAGVPADILWELLGDSIREWIRENGSLGSLATVLAAVDLTGAGTATSAEGSVVKAQPAPIGSAPPSRGLGIGFSWRRTDLPLDTHGVDVHGRLDGRDVAAIDGVGLAKTINDYLAQKETLVVLNRQPSLHKYSFQAFKPVATNPDDGEVLRLPPLCCKGFAADFDGDEMVGHVPLSQEAQAEAQRLLPENNLLSVADGEPLPNLDRDLVSGLLLVHDRLESPRWNFNITTLPECCLEVLRSERVGSEKFGKNLVKHLCERHSDDGFGRFGAIRLAGECARLAWKACTVSGFSFGFYDLLDISGQVGSAMAGAEDDDTVKNLVAEILKSVREDASAPSGAKAVASMVLSDANGQSQIPQVVARRGQLEGLADAKGIPSSLVGGMTWEELFDASWNARRSMCDKKLGTARGGDLTRRLVFALWPRFGIDGLVAAQSIGERGTQLAMRSFHAGKRDFDIARARSLFLRGCIKVDGEGKRPQAHYPKDFEEFCNAARRGKDYSKLREEHFKIVWDAIQELPKDSKGKPVCSLDKAIGSSGGDFAWLLLQEQSKRLMALFGCDEWMSLTSPFARVLFNRFPQQGPDTGKED